MNDRVSAFCTGMGFAGLMMFFAFAVSGKNMADIVAGILMAWSLVLTPMGIVDFYCDWRGSRTPMVKGVIQEASKPPGPPPDPPPLYRHRAG